MHRIAFTPFRVDLAVVIQKLHREHFPLGPSGCCFTPCNLCGAEIALPDLLGVVKLAVVGMFVDLDASGTRAVNFFDMIFSTFSAKAASNVAFAFAAFLSCLFVRPGCGI